VRKGLQEADLNRGNKLFPCRRFAEGDLYRWPQLAKELVALKPRAIVTVGYLNSGVLQFVPDVSLVFTAIAADLLRLDPFRTCCAPDTLGKKALIAGNSAGCLIDPNPARLFARSVLIFFSDWRACK
jgi:hypothetical protein